VDREKKPELLPHQSIDLPSNFSHLEFHAIGLVGKKKPRLPLNIQMAAVIMYSLLLPLDIILQGFGAASANHKKQFPLSLSLSQLLSTLRVYMFRGNEQRKFIIANKASCE
jgi:hypothetical protein